VKITTQHLEKLVEEGRVRREVGGRGWFGGLFGREERYFPDAAEMESSRARGDYSTPRTTFKAAS